MTRSVIRLALLLPLLAGCAAWTSRQPASEPAVQVVEQGVRSVTVAEARPLAEQGVTVLDVRTPEEFQAGHVPGARNMPLQTLSQWAPGLAKDQPYVVICRSGKRSTTAVQQLEAQGFRTLLNVTGGMLEWEKRGFPTEK